jgi:uncharacterized protein (DUF1499 family)
MHTRFVTIGIVVVAAAVLALVLSGPGTRLGLWHFRIGLMMVAASGLLGLTGAILALIGFFRARSTIAGIAVLIGVGMFALVAYSVLSARKAPRIHDISTDLNDPPHFRAVLPLRGTTSNPVNGIDPRVAAQQRAGYPDITTLYLGVPPNEAFQRVRNAAKKMGWAIAEASDSELRLEATDTTSWMGFRDDIVVRVRPTEAGSQIDVRSASRVGIGDTGMNARRIRAFLSRL